MEVSGLCSLEQYAWLQGCIVPTSLSKAQVLILCICIFRFYKNEVQGCEEHSFDNRRNILLFPRCNELPCRGSLAVRRNLLLTISLEIWV